MRVSTHPCATTRALLTPTDAIAASGAGSTSTPAVPATGPQQLYAALVAAGANLFAFRDGTDAVGHASLSN